MWLKLNHSLTIMPLHTVPANPICLKSGTEKIFFRDLWLNSVTPMTIFRDFLGHFIGIQRHPSKNLRLLVITTFIQFSSKCAMQLYSCNYHANHVVFTCYHVRCMHWGQLIILVVNQTALKQNVMRVCLGYFMKWWIEAEAVYATIQVLESVEV